jgi:hypothetical protein
MLSDSMEEMHLKPLHDRNFQKLFEVFDVSFKSCISLGHMHFYHENGR